VLKFATDEKILKYANKNHRIIITKDIGFAEDFIKNKGFGLILIRLPYYFTADEIIRVFSEFLKEVNEKDFINSITVLELGRYRVKKI